MSTKVQETPAPAMPGIVEIVAPAALLVLLDKEVIKSNQDSIRKNLLSLDGDVHSNAVQCMLHAKTHGDTSLFARLLNDILDEKTGYNRRGVIRWMRAFSPMELDGKKITLTGLDENGKRRQFDIEKANATPFYTSAELNQQGVKPIFQDTLLSKFDTMVREFERSWENTKQEGDKLLPIDPKKPYYMGTPSAAAKVVSFIESGKLLRGTVVSDDSRDIYMAQQRLARDEALASAAAA